MKTTRPITSLIYLVTALSVRSEVLTDFLTLKSTWPDEPAQVRDFQLHGDLLYLLNGPNLEVLDVSDWENPILVGELTLPNPVDVNSWWDGSHRIVIGGKTAYIENSILSENGWLYQPTSYRTMVDISDPTKPILLGSTEFVSRYMAADDRVVVGVNVGLRTEIFSPDKSGVLVKRSELMASGIPTLHGDLLYLMEDDLLKIVDISDLSRPRLIEDKDSWRNTGYGSIGVLGQYVFDGENDRDVPVLKVTDVSDPLNFERIAEIPLEACDSISDFAVQYPILYVRIAFRNGLEADIVLAIDVSVPSDPTVIGRSLVEGSFFDMKVSGSRIITTIDGQIRLYESAFEAAEDPLQADLAFKVWERARLEPDQSGAYADPDRDGLVNLMEFANGSNPMIGGETSSAITTNAEGQLVFQFSKGKEAKAWLDYQVEVNADLRSENWLTSSVPVKISDVFGKEMYEVALLSDEHNFARLRIVMKK